ncbi:hypothetical protein [Vibrio marisflavi]|uniref:Hydroxylamine reductase n=1 Tax=Vibrio marisflavi CECT 7928 TaxID=634439 RepID=A0ABN8E043_9VIBR|nr:hypothetical protein [Vibrio marisflavi]CAH0537563.1 hypothetical protein VMF7928_01174 [Vibrio marisflavi CECT 7928]
MKKYLILIFAAFVGFFTLLTSLFLAIPLAIVAVLAGKKMQSQIKKQQQTYTQTEDPSRVIEGEYEDLSRK